LVAKAVWAIILIGFQSIEQRFGSNTMNLMAWIRKNNKKLMAVVVIALMFVFTIEPVMNYLSSRRAGGHTVTARYNDSKKITLRDRAWAQKQLEILKMLKADIIFRPIDPRLMQSQDLRVTLLGELLFAERSSAAETISYVRQLVRKEGLAVTDEQINDLYNKTYPSDIYWLLLTNETRFAGVRIPLEIIRGQLETLAPQLQRGLTYSKLVGGITKRHGVSEEQILEAFADFVAVTEYAKVVCSMEDRTNQQTLLETNWQEETIDVEYVPISSNEFVHNVQRPGEKRIREQFEKYKDVFRGDVNEGNPYGFGYKLPDRVQLEYMAVQIDNVASTIPHPAQEEMEDFYQRNLSHFIEQVPSDPNDPNSSLQTRTRSYAEVAGAISKLLYQRKVVLKTEQIVLEAKSITEANFAGIDEEQAKISDEEIRRLAGDYEKTAAQLGEKYKIKVYAGKTGLLSAADIQGDKILGMLYLEGVGFSDVGLVRVVFAAEPLKASVLGPVDVRPPRLYQNIGLFKDARTSIQGYAGKNMMLVRIVGAEKAAAPLGIDQKIDRSTVHFEDKTAEDINTVRELVVDDLKRLAAMNKAGQKANEFVKLAKKDGWDTALEKLNRHFAEIYKKAKGDANEAPKIFTLERRAGLRRISQIGNLALETRYQGDPLATEILARGKAERILIDSFYALVPEDANTLPTPGVVVEFKPGFNFYCIKNLVIHRMYREQYDEIKGMLINHNEYGNAQELALTFYNPGNILKRTKFQPVRESKTPQSQIPERQDTNNPSTSADESEAAEK
jgi:hypothetical protein